MSEPIPRKPSRRKFLKGGLATLTAGSAVDALFVEPVALELNTIEIPIQGLAKEFDGFKIGLLADLHYPRFADQGLIQKAIKLLNSFESDLIVMPGDLVAQRQGIDDVPDFTGLFSGLRAREGLYYTLGNHDHWVDARLVRAQMRWNTPFQTLEHRRVLLERGSAKLAIGGVGDLWTGTVNIDDTFDDVPSEVPRILLCHNPDVAETSVSMTRVDLMLSGHTHGGQICVPGRGPIQVPSAFGAKFAQGLVEGKRYRVFVTRGVCSVLGARFWCRPEVNGIILRRM